MRARKQRKIPHISYNDVETLLQRRIEEAPKSGDYLFDYKLEVLKKEIETMNDEEIKKKVKIKFTDLPISRLTQNGLKKRNFKVMTEIQRCVLPHALADRDILGASKTGSGKTLSYLIPVIEKLYTQKFNPLDGLGALIILPTRELALQVFEVLASITSEHLHLSMGLIIGGKNVKYEKEKIERMNILIATPGRLLQHMDESPGFDASQLRILVLDEVDMLLELGFANTLESILVNLGKERQTLLFSATLTKEIHNLAKLSLNKPEYISLHESRVAKGGEGATGQEEKIPMQYEVPKGLSQYYMQIKIEDKLDTLFSFLRTHTKTKSLVFFSSIKQVRFAYEAFRKLNLSRALPLFELHGKQKQPQRMAIFFGFKEKKHASMFTTNIAARGLDFPSVDWVIQVDCPEDVATYVHRVGRTARYKAGGKSLLLMSPSEEKFITKLKTKGISLNRIYPNPNKALTIKSSLQSFLTEDMNLKHLAQKAFISYVRSVHLQADKEVFDVRKIDTDSLAESLGLIQAPVLRFVTKDDIPDEVEDDEEEEQAVEEQKTGEKKKKKSKLAKLKEKIKQKREEKLQKQIEEQDEDEEEGDEEGDDDDEEKPTAPVPGKRAAKVDLEEESDDDFLKIKRRDHEINLNAEPIELKVSKSALKKIKDEGYFGGRNRTVYDEEGKPYTPSEMKARQIAELTKDADKRKDEPALNYIKRKILNEEHDKEREKERVREKRLKRKLKMKAQDQGGEERIAVLGSPGEYDEEEGDYDDEEDQEEYGSYNENDDDNEDFEEEDME